MSEATTTDVVVLGMGPGGEAAAGVLAEAGLDVVGIDRELVGGECPYWACVPSKMMVRAGNVIAEARRIAGLAGDATVRHDWTPVARRIRDEATADWDDTAAVERFEGKGGRFVRGEGRIVGAGRVAVDDEEFHAGVGIVVSTGARPSIPPIPGLDDVPYWTNREATEAAETPPSLAVLGAGAVGVELSQAYHRFGTEVTVIEAADRLVPSEEPESSAILADVFAAEGIDTRVGASAESVHGDDKRVVVELDDGTTVEAARLLVATGRRSDLAAAGLGAVGIDESQRVAPVDEHLRIADGVWAVGDITGKGPFTHVAMYQAAIAAADIMGRPHAPADYRALPRVTFTDPEIGTVGLTEAEARDAGVTVRVGKTPTPESTRGWIHGAGNDGVIKLVEDASRGVLVGATSMGPAGGEVLGALVVAVHAEVPTARLGEMIYAYPTFHRGIEDALRDLADG